MRQLIRLSLVLLLLVGLSVGRAAAATTASQLVELMKAGLSDEILIALIQTDGSTFQLSAADILALHKQGLSNTVIRAMQETARKTPADRDPSSLAIEPRPLPTQSFQQIVEPIVPTPAVVNVYQTVTQRVEPTQSYYQPAFPFIAVPVAVPVILRRPVVTRSAPVFWGWGGQRRPDSWNDREVVDPINPKTPDKSKGGG